jgi:hypothetical protein
MRRVAYPFPEFLSEHPWDIRNTESEAAFVGHTRSDQHIMQVPLVRTPTARFIRAHESVHIAITPARDSLPPDIQHPVHELVEEARVNYVVRHCLHIPETLSPSPEATYKVSRIAHTLPHQQQLLRAISVYGRWEYHTAQAALSESTKEALDTILEKLFEGCNADTFPSVEHSYSVCRLLQQTCAAPAADPLDVFDSAPGASAPSTTQDTEVLKAIKAHITKPKKEFDAPPAPPSKASILADILGEPAPGHTPDTPPPPAPIKSPPPIVPPAPRDPLAHSLTPTQLWATPHIHEYPLALAAIDPKLGRRRTSYSDEGVVPQAWHRRCIDGSIFVRRTRGKAMSILCDVSGSMSVSFEDIAEFLIKAPNSIVATYCSKNGSHLSILAKRGKRASRRVVAKAPHSGGNACDGLALRWLAKQPQPRVWISDGYVIPEGHKHRSLPRGARMPIAALDCLNVCLDAGIKQFQDFDTFLAAVGNHRFDQWHYCLPYLSIETYYNSGTPVHRMPPSIREGYKL